MDTEEGTRKERRGEGGAGIGKRMVKIKKQMENRARKTYI